MMKRSRIVGLLVVAALLVAGIGLAGATGDSGTAPGTDPAVSTVDGEQPTALTADRTLNTTEAGPGDTVTVTTTIEPDIQEDNMSVVEEFSPDFGSANLVSITEGGDDVSPVLTAVGPEGVIIVLEDIGPQTINIVYQVTVPSDAQAGETYTFDGTVETDNETISVGGDQQLVVSQDTAEFDVEITSVEDSVEVGEEVTVESEVTNTGNESGTQTLAFEVDGEEVRTEEVTLEPDESETVTFTYETTTEDTPEIEVTVASEDDSASATVEVTGPATFEVEITSVEDSVEAGEEVTVEVEVTNTGNESGTQTLAFEVDGEEVGTEEVMLEPDESETVTFTYETTTEDTPEIEVTVASEDDSASATVEVTGPATFEVEITSVEQEVDAGDEVVVEAEVTNTGNESGTQTLAFEVDGEEVGTEEVTLEPDESETVTFTYETTTEDTPEIEVTVASEDDSATATVTVLGQPSFQVKITGIDGIVEVGEDVTAEYVVENTGDLEGTQELTFTVNGSLEAVETVTLAADETFEGSFTYGTGEDDLPAIDVTVSSENDTASRVVDVVGSTSLVVRDVEPAASVLAGDSLDVAVTVENTADGEVTEPVLLVVEDGTGDVVDTVRTEVTVEGGGTETVTLTYDTRMADPPAVFVFAETGNGVSDPVEVTVEQPSRAFALTVDSVDDEVEPGEEITVAFTVENVGNVEGTQDITFSVDGSQVNVKTITLASGETTNGTFSYVPTAADSPEVNLALAGANESVRTAVAVAYDGNSNSSDEDGDDDTGDDGTGDGTGDDTSDDTSDTTGDDGPDDDGTDDGRTVVDDSADDDGPGFGPVVVLVGMAFLTVYSLRRREPE